MVCTAPAMRLLLLHVLVNMCYAFGHAINKRTHVLQRRALTPILWLAESFTHWSIIDAEAISLTRKGKMPKGCQVRQERKSIWWRLHVPAEMLLRQPRARHGRRAASTSAQIACHAPKLHAMVCASVLCTSAAVSHCRAQRVRLLASRQ